MGIVGLVDGCFDYLLFDEWGNLGFDDYHDDYSGGAAAAAADDDGHLQRSPLTLVLHHLL